MAYKYREELVGKRFISVSGGIGKLNAAKVSDWGWRAGVIRAATHKDNKHKELQVLVEFDDVAWQRREWLPVRSKRSFRAFFVEKNLNWAQRSSKAWNSKWPALSFTSLASDVELSPNLQPIEYLLDKELHFTNYSELSPFQEWEKSLLNASVPATTSVALSNAVRSWIQLQDGQHILTTTPSVLAGFRAQVYRVAGTTQWYTAVIVGYNEATGELTVTDDTVLEEHNEDPTLVQMRLIGDGVVECIMRGEVAGITSRRSRSSALMQNVNGQVGREGRNTAAQTQRKLKTIKGQHNANGPPDDQIDSADKGKSSKKRKPSESDNSVLPVKSSVSNSDNDNKCEASCKEDASGKIRKRNEREPKKKVLEEAENSKLREAKITVVEKSDVARPVGGACAVPGAEGAEVTVAYPGVGAGSEEDDCVIVCAAPASASRPRRSDAEDGGSPAAGDRDGCARDDRSDSGVSGLRSGGSGDERSGSRSSALSGDEPAPAPPAPAAVAAAAAAAAWRAMAHAPAHAPPASAFAAAAPPPLLHLPPPGLYPHDLLWKTRYPHRPVHAPHQMPPAHPAHALQHPAHALQHAHLPIPEDYLERERAYVHDRQRHETLLRERREQEAREIEKQQMKEREKERERIEREREKIEREKQEQERERQEKAVHKHFEESLRLANQKFYGFAPMQRERAMSWSMINCMVPPSRTAPPAPMPAAPPSAQPPTQTHHALNERLERHYYTSNPIQRPPSIPNKTEYPPPAHSRVSIVQKPLEKTQTVHTSLPKAEPNFNIYGYPQYQTTAGFAVHDVKLKNDISVKQNHLHNSASLKLSNDRELALPTPPPLLSELKNSVIVKHDGKGPPIHHLEQKAHAVAHSPKLRTTEIPTHYSPVQQPYRTPPHPQQHHQHTTHPLPQHSPHLQDKHRARTYRPPLPSPRQSHYSTTPVPQTYPQPPVKPKVSSPAPPTIYGPPASKPALCDPLPLATRTSLSGPPRAPPPAHSRPRLSTRPDLQLPPPHQLPAPQAQPLDLGVSSRDDPDRSPRRRATPNNCIEDPTDPKRRRLSDLDPFARRSPLSDVTIPQLSRAGEPSPLIASAATAITTVVNTAAFSDPSSPPRRPPSDPPSEPPARLPSADGAAESFDRLMRNSPSPLSSTSVTQTSIVSGSPIPATVPPAESPPIPLLAPNTPKPPTPVPPPAPTPPPVTLSSQPTPITAASPRESSQPVRHLKKAWLQRHETAPAPEECEGGGGTCVTLPMEVPPRLEPEGIIKSLNCVGSMAVNSISRPKGSKGRKPINKEINGHSDKVAEDSSSSDQDRESKNIPKRKPPKAKRKKGGRKPLDDTKKKKMASNSESGSDSDKESISDKDSESGRRGGARDNRKRGRRGRGRNSTGDDNSNRSRRSGGGRGDSPPPGGLRRPSIAYLRRTGEAFMQDGACFEVAARLTKCRECRWSAHQRDKNQPNIFCRFFAFRRLRYAKNGQLAIAGFSDPNIDANEADKNLWSSSSGGDELDVEMSCFLLQEVGDQFCELLKEEQEAINHHLNEDKTIAWKRVVQGVREMCDVCETTLFNFHWTCGKCGFVVCLDCYKARILVEAAKSPDSPLAEEIPIPSPVVNASDSDSGERDTAGWLTCTSGGAAHAPRGLLLTQIAAGGALANAATRSHMARVAWGLGACRSCDWKAPEGTVQHPAARRLLRRAIAENIKKETKIKDEEISPESSTIKTESRNVEPARTWSPKEERDIKSDSSTSSDSENDESFSTLRELLIRPTKKSSSSSSEDSSPPNNGSRKSKRAKLDVLQEVISSVLSDNDKGTEENANQDDEENKFDLRNMVERYRPYSSRDNLVVRVMTLTESKLLYPEVPHSWLCNGTLLHLMDPNHPGNYKPFQDQWKRGQPVLVSDVLKNLDKDLWTPESFARDFGEERNDLINCASGLIVPNQTMRKFWDGFELAAKRLRDDRGAPMVLKLKDWPPGEDFSELLPTRFKDLMAGLPLKHYTAREGRLNLAARLPECFVRPDLGPKLYTAYGGLSGTTNLHLDVSDAVNVMVYAGTPKDATERAREAARAADEAGADPLSRRRARRLPPGALWHIYAARDADKIRDLLNRVSIERGIRPRPGRDPVHDQTWYLDTELRGRLYREYGVEGYAILQSPGDAVFIPAGAPHQVRNLLDCIKAAEDFVSPENVSRCFELAQQFRRLSAAHSNREDKLQIKNIVYHAVKDSLSRLERTLQGAETEYAPESC